MSNPSLIERKVQEPPAAVLFEAQRQTLYSYVRGLIRHPQDAEDLVQEVWVRYSRALRDGKRVEDTPSWCRGVARNLALHYWRKQRRSPVTVDDELLDLIDRAFAEQDNQNQKELWKQRNQALDECLEDLPERSRKLVSLKYLGGLTADVIGKQLGRTGSSVLMALSRIRQVLRQCVERKLDAGGDYP